MAEEEKSLFQKLEDYKNKKIYPLHMPGHKREKLPYMNEILSQMFTYDITEIPGFDDLHKPEGILKESMEILSELYGASKSYFLVNGSSGGILSAIGACTNIGDEILVARNCHKSVMHAVMHRGLKPVYIYPQLIREKGINGGISPDNVDNMLKKNKNIKAVVIVSPTYDGILSDIKNISKIVHKYKIPLIVDEAHGAHLLFSQFGKTSVQEGADLIIQSFHKTLPSLTQSAVLHWNDNGYVNENLLEKYLHIYQSTSPSYLLMASLDACTRFLKKYGQQETIQFENKLIDFYHYIEEIKGVSLSSKTWIGQYDVAAIDYGKLLISREDRWAGPQIYDILNRVYSIQCEMFTPVYALGMTTLMDSAEIFTTLKKSLWEVGNLDIGIPEGKAVSLPVAEQVMTPYEVLQMDEEVIPLSKAGGRIAKNSLDIYPPGIPVIIGGERFTGEIIEKIYQADQMGAKLNGLVPVEIGRNCHILEKKLYVLVVREK